MKTKPSKKQTCTTRTVSGTVKFTTTGEAARAVLMRGGRTYAKGSARIDRRDTVGTLHADRNLVRGRYQLRLTRDGRVIARRVIVIA